MTPVQARVLDAFRAHVEQFGTEPTSRHLAATLGYSSQGSIHRTLEILVDLKHLERETPRGRRARFRLAAPDLRMVPLDALKAELARRGVTLGALDRPETRTMSSKVAHCAADGCQIDVEEGHLMCRKHWWSLPQWLQRGLFQAHNHRDVAKFSELLVKARDIAATVRS